jgi:hypothetical protein
MSRTARHPTLTGTFLSEREGLFLRGLEEGLPPAAAAARAGYENPAATARALLLRPHIRDEVARLQARIADELSVSRMKVFEMLKTAYDLAILKEDANAIVRVVAEINKMSGYYHEQRKEGQASLEQLENSLQPSEFVNIPDEELAKLANLSEE